jgi:hypothetical protein
MKFLAIEKEDVDVKAEQFAPHLKEESIKVLELFEKDIIREIYFDQSHCAVIILECNSVYQAEEELKKLPLVQKGLIKFEVRELNPYTGFSRLLK